MLLIDTNALEVILITITSLIGIFSISVSMEGYMFSPVKGFERLIMLGAGLMLIHPNILTDLVGIVIIGIMVVLQASKSKKAPSLIEASS